jgi:Curlin associated repeat
MTTHLRRGALIAALAIATPAWAGPDNLSSIDQIGEGNRASVQQHFLAGDGMNAAMTSQNGIGNQSDIAQDGSALSASVEQSGADNRAIIEQNGLGHEAGITQYGDGLTAKITQDGVGKTFSIIQDNMYGAETKNPVIVHQY